jgi:hypothetical protein
MTIEAIRTHLTENNFGGKMSDSSINLTDGKHSGAERAREVDYSHCHEASLREEGVSAIPYSSCNKRMDGIYAAVSCVLRKNNGRITVES